MVKQKQQRTGFFSPWKMGIIIYFYYLSYSQKELGFAKLYLQFLEKSHKYTTRPAQKNN